MQRILVRGSNAAAASDDRKTALAISAKIVHGANEEDA